MDWLFNLIKKAQIAGNLLPQTFWFHGTNTLSAYEIIKDMFVRPRQETGDYSYTGSLSSLQDAVYLTSHLPKAIKHAKEKTQQSTGSQGVVLVIRPEDLGYVHIDEDFVHMILLGKHLWDNYNWEPSPKLVQEIFEMGDEILNATTYYPELNERQAVLKYINNMGDSNYDIEDSYLQEEGIVPQDGLYEYDAVMQAAKTIAKQLNDKHQQQAINGFQNLAHSGKVRAYEIYLIPEEINIGEERDYWVDPRFMRTYEELRKYCTKIDPKQLLMPFMKREAQVDNPELDELYNYFAEVEPVDDYTSYNRYIWATKTDIENIIRQNNGLPMNKQDGQWYGLHVGGEEWVSILQSDYGRDGPVCQVSISDLPNGFFIANDRDLSVDGKVYSAILLSKNPIIPAECITIDWEKDTNEAMDDSGFEYEEGFWEQAGAKTWKYVFSSKK